MSLFNSLTSGGSQYAPKPFKRPSMGSSAPYMPTVVDQPRQGQSQIAFENEKRKLNHQRQMNNIFGYGHDGSSMQGRNSQQMMAGSKPVIGQPLRNTGGTNPSLYSDPNLGQPNPYQTNVDWMNQMAQQNAQVGSDGGSIFPTFSYDPKTNQYMRDSSAFGLTGDAANTYYSPEDFQSEFGRTLGKMPSQGGGGGTSYLGGTPNFNGQVGLNLPENINKLSDLVGQPQGGGGNNFGFTRGDGIGTQAMVPWENPDTGETYMAPDGAYSPPEGSSWVRSSMGDFGYPDLNLGQTGQDVPPTGIANDPVLTNGSGYFDTSGGANTYGQTPTGQAGGGLDYSGMSTSTGGLDTGMALAGLGGLFTGGSLQDFLGTLGGYYRGKEGIEAAYGTGEAGFNLAEQIGQRAAEGSQFKPYTVTSNLAQVQTDPRGGYNVNLSPQQQALQNQALGQAGQFFGQAGSYDPSIAAQRGAMGGLFGQSLGQYGQPTGLEGLTQAGISGAQGQLSRAGQPFDINQLRGQFAGQVGSYLGQQPDAGIGALGQQALRLGSQGLGRSGQGQEGFGSLQGLLTSQAGSRLQDSASTLPSQVASQVYGLGMQGLQDRSAPTDIEALRSQYAGLAGQAGQGLLSTPEQRQADIYESIRATQTPEEQRQRLALEERMLAQGRTGVSSDAYGGASPELLAMETARQEAMARAGLSARQQAMAEQQQGLATAQSLTGLTTGLAGTSSDLQSAAQSRASQLTQLGLSADQIQSQLESEGLSRGLQTTQAAGQMAGIRSDLDSASQARATQLSQLGLSAEQIESQLRSEGLSRATTAGTTAGQLAGIASDLETAGIGRGTALANLGLAGTQASNTMGRQQLEDLMNLQRSDMSSAQIQQALQQGNLGLGTGMLQAGYMPQQQALEMLRQSQVPAQFASAGRLQGADLQAQLGGRGIESLMQGSQLANELRQQQLAASLQSVLGAQSPTTGSFGGGLLERLLGGSGGEYDWLPDWIGNPVYSDLEDETDEYDDYYDYDGGE